MVPTPSQGLSTAVRSQQLLKAQYGTMALGLSGVLGQVFIIVTISKFGALTCSIIGLARKVTTLVASIYFYGHVLNATQLLGLAVCIGAMTLSFMNKKGGKGGHGHGPPPPAVDQGPPTVYHDVVKNDNSDDEEEDDAEQDEEKPLVSELGETGLEMKSNAISTQWSPGKINPNSVINTRTSYLMDPNPSLKHMVQQPSRE